MRIHNSILTPLLVGCLGMATLPARAEDPPPPRAEKRRSKASPAPSAVDIDRMTTYATLLGRAIGCGIDVDPEMRRVGRWMDRTFPPGSAKQKTYLPIFMAGIKHHAEEQRAGRSPDSCTTLRREVKAFPWP